MNAGNPVDVLAVLDKAASEAIGERDMHDANDNKSAADGWEKLRSDLREAREAVAELIEAARDVALYGTDRTDRTARRLDAALARVGGAK